MVKVGIYLGTSSDPTENITPVLESWCSALANYDLEVFGSASPPESLQNRCRYVGMEPLSDDLPQKILRGYQYTKKYIRENDPDVIIQLWKYATHAPGVALAGQQYQIPTVGRFTGDTFNEFHGTNFPRSIGVFGLNNIITRVPLHLLDKTIALGPYGKDELVSRGMSSEDVAIIPPPAPTDTQFSLSESKESLREDLGIPHDQEVILYVGRMTDQKGMEFLQEAISALPSLNDYLFLLIGSGPYQYVFNQEFDDDDVRAIGRISHREIDKYYKMADCYVHPSPYEGIPLVILEALSCGTSVLARPAGDIGFVSDNITHTPQEMAADIYNNNYDNNWNNKELFKLDKQQERLTSIIDDVIN